MIDQNQIMPMTSDTDKDSGIGTRPLSELLVDLHVYRIPNDYWLSERHLAKNQAIEVSISAGFVRVLPELTLQDVRKEIAYQLGYDTLPTEFVFLRSIGRNFAKALEPELHLLEDPDSFLPYSSPSELEVNATVDKLSGRRRTRRFQHYHHTLQRRASSARSFERISGYDSPINSRFPPLQSSTPAPTYSISSANNAEDLGESTVGNKNSKFPKVVKNTVRIKDDNDHGEAGDTDVTNSSRDSGLTESSQEGPKTVFPRLPTFDEFDRTRLETAANRSRVPRYKPRDEMVFHAKMRYGKDYDNKPEVVNNETDKLEKWKNAKMSDSRIEYEEDEVHRDMEHEKVTEYSTDEFLEIMSIRDKCIIGDGKDHNVIHGSAPEATPLTMPETQLKSVQEDSNGKDVQSTIIPKGDATNERQREGSIGQSSVDIQRDEQQRKALGSKTNIFEESNALKPTNDGDLNAENVRNEVEISSVNDASKTRNKSEISSKKSSIPRSIVRARGRKEKGQRPIGQPQNKSGNTARQSGHFTASKEEIAKGEQTLRENGQEETAENKLLISEQGQLNSRDVGRGQQGTYTEVAKVSASDNDGEQDSTTHLQAAQNADDLPKTPTIPKIQKKQNGQKELHKYRRVVRNPRNESKKTSSADQSGTKENQLLEHKRNFDQPYNRISKKAQIKTSPNAIMMPISDTDQHPGGNAWFYDLKSEDTKNENFAKNEENYDKRDNRKSSDSTAENSAIVGSEYGIKPEDGEISNGAPGEDAKLITNANLAENTSNSENAKDAANDELINIPEIQIDNLGKNDTLNMRAQLAKIKNDISVYTESGPTGSQSEGKDKAKLRAKFLEKVKMCAKIIQELYPSETQGQILESHTETSETTTTTTTTKINNVSSDNSAEGIDDQKDKLISDRHDTVNECDKNLIKIKERSDSLGTAENKNGQLNEHNGTEEKVVIPPSTSVSSSTPTHQRHGDQNMPITDHGDLKYDDMNQNQASSKVASSEFIISESTSSNLSKQTIENPGNVTLEEHDNTKSKDNGRKNIKDLRTQTIKDSRTQMIKNGDHERFEQRGNKRIEDIGNKKIKDNESQKTEDNERQMIKSRGNKKIEVSRNENTENRESEIIRYRESKNTGNRINKTKKQNGNKKIDDHRNKIIEGRKNDNAEAYSVRKSEDCGSQTTENRDQAVEDRGCQTIKMLSNESIEERRNRTLEDRGIQTLECSGNETIEDSGSQASEDREDQAIQNRGNELNKQHENKATEGCRNKKLEYGEARMGEVGVNKVIKAHESAINCNHRNLNENNLKQGSKEHGSQNDSSRSAKKQDRIINDRVLNQNDRSGKSNLQPLKETKKQIRKHRQSPVEIPLNNKPTNYAKMPKCVQDRIERNAKNRRDHEHESLSKVSKRESVADSKRRQSLSSDRQIDTRKANAGINLRNGNDRTRSRSTFRSLDDKPKGHYPSARDRSDEYSLNSKGHRNTKLEVLSPQKTLKASPLKQANKQQLEVIEKSQSTKSTINSNETVNLSPDASVDSYMSMNKSLQYYQNLHPTLSPPSRCHSLDDRRSSKAEENSLKDIRKTKSEIFELENNDRSGQQILNWLHEEQNSRMGNEVHPKVAIHHSMPQHSERELPEVKQAICSDLVGNMPATVRISKPYLEKDSTPLNQRKSRQHGSKQPPLKYSELPRYVSKRSNMIDLKAPNIRTQIQIQQRRQEMDQRVLRLDRETVTEEDNQVSTNKRIKRSLMVSIDDLPSWLVSSKGVQHGIHDENNLNRRQLLAIHRVLRTRRRRAKRIYHYYIRYLLYLRGRRQDGTGRASGVADMWKRKYVEEARETQLLKDHCRRMAQHLELLRHQTSKRSFPATLLDPSNQTSYKMAASKLVNEIEELSRQVEIAKVKLMAESKLKDQVEQEMKILRTEVVDRKIDASVTRGQFQQHQQAQYPLQWLNHTMTINSTMDAAIDEALLLN